MTNHRSIERPGEGPLPAENEAGEREFVRRCVDGDARARHALYDRHLPDIERLLAARGITGVAANDVCQDIFVSIYCDLVRFGGEARLSTWIHRLATRKAIGHARRQRLLRGLTQLFVSTRSAALPTG
jgi:DNA-directed RNA polymerase specialized sigma24 family protein